MEELRNLGAAFTHRQLLNYRRGDTLVVNDPYLGTVVEVTAYGGWYRWTGPSGEPQYGDVHAPGPAVDTIIRQYAGLNVVAGGPS
ncbi:hypothetical protein [Nocardiopsis aegyptia]|uniref:Uncharacterized protein n=1 Tax=Nocardiopsis aegyptia TaxID=220378 RepID=A0A7Z0ESA3_9ACTN|nr:hypothetical protein [Nocardiopsis aegyptia]NYJ37342.1 hypothetical protein [Nocardiopsis aegyptia]